jgi:hypothetical protein
VTSDLTSDILIRRAALFYEFFYNALHWATWMTEPRILTHLGSDGDGVFLRLLPSEDAHSFQMDKSLRDAIAAEGGVYAVKDLDDDSAGFRLSFPDGGDQFV